MASIGILFAIGIIVFSTANVFLFLYGILKISFFITIMIEAILLWVCFGPELILYYTYTLKQNIESYAYLYEQYEENKKTIEILEKERIKERKKYAEAINNVSNKPTQIIEIQRRQIEELNEQLYEMERQNIELREIAKKAKQINETNKKLKEDNQKLKQMINYIN